MMDYGESVQRLFVFVWGMNGWFEFILVLLSWTCCRMQEVIDVLCIDTFVPQCSRLLGFEDESLEGTEEVFDLVLSDGTKKVKVVLFPVMNTWIKSGDIQVLDTIIIRKWKAHQLPQGGRIFPVLEHFSRDTTGNTKVNFENQKKPITWHRDFMLRTEINKPYEARPLLPVRRIYLSPYIDDCLPFAQSSPLFTR